MPFKAQNDYIFKKFGGGMAPLAPPGYAYASMTCFLEILIYWIIIVGGCC